jgi:hypothetical protein
MTRELDRQAQNGNGYGRYKVTVKELGIGGYSSDRSSAHYNPADNAALQCTQYE